MRHLHKSAGPETIWAPWRLDYIRNARRDERCIFCVSRKAGPDPKRYIFLRSATCFAMLNRYPYNNGHMLIAPYRHVGDFGELRRREMLEMMHLMGDCIDLLRRVLEPQGFNVGLNLGAPAGAGVVEHLHWHLVPRWVGDTNYMPVTANTKVIPQLLDDLYRQLLRALRSKGRSPRRTR